MPTGLGAGLVAAVLERSGTSELYLFRTCGARSLQPGSTAWPAFADVATVSAICVDSSLKSLTFAFASSASVEVIGIDSVRITGNAVPEPSTLAIWSLLALCGIGIDWHRRRKA